MGVGVTEVGQYNGKITWFVLLSCVIAATGGLIFGYVTAVTGGVTSMEPFLKKFYPGVYRKMNEQDIETSNYCKFDSQLLTSFTSSIFISGLIATFFASAVTKAFGRKASIFIGGTALIAGSALGGAAENLYMLMFGRLLLGVGVGFTNQSIPLYLSEMAPPKYRGAFNFGFQLCVAAGGLLAFLVNYGIEKIQGGWGWRISLAMAGVPASFLTICAPFLPETPNSLIQQGNDHAKAKKMLQKIRGTNDVEAEFDDLISASNASKTIKHPFYKILERKYRPQLVMSVAIPLFQQVTGISVICFYAPILFRSIGSGVSASLLSSVALGVVGTSTTLFSMFIVDKLGRRTIFHIGGIQMLIPQMLIGGIMAAKFGDHGELSKGYSILVLILICIYAAGFAFSWGPLAWLVTSEIFPLEISDALPFQVHDFLLFRGVGGADDRFRHVLVPETKDVPIEKMDKIWREHKFWKRFVGDGQEYEVSKIEGP
ncbi:hypothetical protein DH2020_034046 [Rehmannia glutinosa]|uniref:Major facilitator superfamily (MFS) profile domain-containing protein n=1 Tax=Rehmannia glutinosa TaxID=99300 RepID=A0ABR0VD20_REHGL